MQGVECLAELKQKKEFDDHLNKKNELFCFMHPKS